MATIDHTSTSVPSVVCKNITKSYGQGVAKVDALRGVSLELYPGKLHLLMGPSGSGKTTLISIIAGILTQDSGLCLINNIDINHLTDFERTQFRSKEIGFVFQAFNLIPMLTLEENVSVPLLLQGALRSEALERSQKALAEMGLADKVGKKPSELSGGQQQRVAIARAIIHEPSFIVCDEPTSFLDHERGNKIMTLLRDLAHKKNVTLVVVTHDPRIVPFADHIYHLEDGRISPMDATS